MILELKNRVFELTMTPGAEVPGVRRREIRLVLLSGPCLTEEEFNRVVAGLIADVFASGGEVVSWGGVEEDDES